MTRTTPSPDAFFDLSLLVSAGGLSVAAAAVVLASPVLVYQGGIDFGTVHSDGRTLAKAFALPLLVLVLAGALALAARFQTPRSQSVRQLLTASAALAAAALVVDALLYGALQAIF